ncbi:MAG: hypothetical protein RR091_09755, partial [Cloacibacillus sp.]
MNIDERMRTVNMPQYIKSRGMFQKNKHFIPNFQMATSDTIDKDYINIQNTNIYVLKECYANGLNEAYFNTTTKNRHIYAVLEKYSGYLPCGVVPFLISFEKIAPNEMPTDYTYKEIEVRLEDITIKDLYINANFYAYCYETDTYMPVPAKAAEIATLKSVLERDIVVLGGDAYDRIADYGRIILFLISKVTLTEQEKSAL